MDPNSNQPINTNPLGQPAQQPVSSPVQPMQPAPTPTPAAPTTPVTAAPEPMLQTPKGGSKKRIVLLIILLLLVLGMGFYVFFAKNQLNTAQKATTDNTSIAIPTVTIAPSEPATVDEVIVASPDADLKDLEADLQGL